MTVEGAEEFDDVIVGGGTAGCLLANRLSADPRRQVCLIEAGGEDDWPWIHIPVGYLYCLGNPRTDWMLRTEAEAGLGGRALLYPRGRVLGGSSSINGMLYLRGQTADYDLWRQAGCTGWGWEEVLPYFLRHEDEADGPSDLHGAGGEWRIEAQRLHWELLDAVRDAFVAAGIPATTDFNRGDNFGVGYFRVNQRRGRRWNTAKAFLGPVRQRPNLVLRTHAAAERLILDGRRVRGVRFRRHGRPGEVLARRGVILAAGAIGTPQLLMLSGIGPGAHLAAMGLPVVLDAPGVGSDLQDHLQLRLAFRVEGARTLNTIAKSAFGKARIALEYALFRSGPMAMAPSQLGAFAKSSQDVATADLEYHVQPLSLDAFGEPLHAFPAFTASVCHLRPESRGTVRLASPDPAAKPRIAPGYLATPGDRRVAAEAIRLTRRIVAGTPLARYRPEEFRPGAEAQTEEELVAAAGRIGTTIFHPVGTARMGSDPGAVTDPRLRVRGIDGLRIADASVMPRITSGNTCSPVLMIAEKAADMILEEP